MPQSIPKGLTREHVLHAMAELDTGIEHPFGDPTGFELLYEGRNYPPKAVVGLAARYLMGRILLPSEFSSGVAKGQAVSVLRELGFNVVRMADDWSALEVSLAVADYFDMLSAELSGEPVNKTEHRKALAPNLNERSNGSIEFKHQNISAVLLNMGLPYISGYKPRGNFQALLAQGVERFMEANPTFFDHLANAKLLNPPTLPSGIILPASNLFVPPPDRIIVPEPSNQPWRSKRGRRIDFALRDAENRRLGRLGEEFTVEVERRRLKEVGRDDLAGKIEWVAETRGDGLGFDVLSFDERNDGERLIEVKTTGLGKFFPFYVTANEVRLSESVADQYHLYRVFDFGQAARLYTLNGALSVTLRLEAVQYRASL